MTRGNRAAEVLDAVSVSRAVTTRKCRDANVHWTLVDANDIPPHIAAECPVAPDGRLLAQWNPPGAWSAPAWHLLDDDEIVGCLDDVRDEQRER